MSHTRLAAIALFALTLASCASMQQTVEEHPKSVLGSGGKRQDASGTACRQPDGSWRIQSQAGPARSTQSHQTAASP